ncbi:hypothetical protein M5X17_27915 [Paenibacillus alvei]|uniref:hypothetical protein n=1 Tax=Paenibacillus alvei TaxID=44250 RepID=UPI00227FFDEB|nr:hypothetical protein [Paenibacillus alvei]MCY9737534.1 hypothetical protein [Paenibacillus alvei]
MLIAERTIKKVVVTDNDGNESVMEGMQLIVAVMPQSQMKWMVATTVDDTEGVLNFAYDMVDEIEFHKLEDEK